MQQIMRQNKNYIFSLLVKLTNPGPTSNQGTPLFRGHFPRYKVEFFGQVQMNETSDVDLLFLLLAGLT